MNIINESINSLIQDLKTKNKKITQNKLDILSTYLELKILNNT